MWWRDPRTRWKAKRLLGSLMMLYGSTALLSSARRPGSVLVGMTGAVLALVAVLKLRRLPKPGVDPEIFG